MRLLIVTQKIDEGDAVLGFMHSWLAEFAHQTDSVIAVCLEKGKVSLPPNTKVFSLGKESGQSRLKYVWRFVRYIVQFRNQYDAVFVHMNPEYIVLGGLFWKLWGKTVTLWYAHKSVTWHLRLAHFFTDIVFTSTESGFRLPSRKVKVVGQGIDVNKFKIQPARTYPSGTGGDSGYKNGEGKFRLVTVGRITPSKDYDTMIDAVEKICQNSTIAFQVDIFGPTSVASDESYLKRLKEKIAQKGLDKLIVFRGPITNASLPGVLQKYDLFVNMGHTGSLDKAVPEAMACGLPILTCNEAFKAVLGPFTGDLMYPKGDSQALAGKIEGVVKLSVEERRALGVELRAIVVRDHSLQNFVGKIIRAIKSFQNHERS
ncbi:MAG: glycosyltransferase [bacterium]|nr:glycosyltransferase [bacterium]